MMQNLCTYLCQSRLRDATTEHEAELNMRIKELEQENYELEETKCEFFSVLLFTSF